MGEGVRGKRVVGSGRISIIIGQENADILPQISVYCNVY